MDSALEERIRKAVEYCLTCGYSVIPISVETKKPAIKWGPYIEQTMCSADWTYDGCNLGIVTGEISGVVVVDCDSTAAYQGWIRHEKPTPMRVKTRRGMHFYYQHPRQYVKSDSHIKHSAGFEYDVKGDRSYVVFPPSLRGGHQYQIVPCERNLACKIVPTHELPVFEMAWRPERAPAAGSYSDQKYINGVKYIESIRAVEGQGGDKDTYRAVCVLRDSGLSETETMAAIMEWNVTNAEPQWGVRELLHKVRCAYSGAAAEAV